MWRFYGESILHLISYVHKMGIIDRRRSRDELRTKDIGIVSLVTERVTLPISAVGL